MAPPAREPWRLLTTWDGEPGWNMALDEALLQGRAARPTLRLYTWRPAALSLGYFQRWSDVPAAAAAPAVVRRLTGGGAIHHDLELTFSIAAPADHPLYRGELANSYGRVHALGPQGRTCLKDFEAKPYTPWSYIRCMQHRYSCMLISS